MTTTAIALSIAILGGALVALQAAANHRLCLALEGDVLVTALVSFGIGFAVLALVVLARGGVANAAGALISAAPGLPWWAFIGGVCGAGYVMSIVVGVSHLGVVWCMAAALLGQQIMALALDHFGAGALQEVPLGFTRVLGVGCLVLGAWLVKPH